MTRSLSPLRYPGGKGALTNVLKEIIYFNNLQGGTYVEPFAGGAGAGLKLLRAGHVDRVVINDLDYAIYSFWKAATSKTDEFIRRIESTPITVSEWTRQREIYRGKTRSHIELGFAAFFLNRCNRSGIVMNGGPIGGLEQTGKWKLDARFNRAELAKRVREIAEYGDRITVTNRSAFDLISELRSKPKEKVFCYVDPPYFVKGEGLYLNFFEETDHAGLARLLMRKTALPWIATYDDVPRIRDLYARATVTPFRLRYSAHAESAEGGEVVISPAHMKLPRTLPALLETRKRNAASRD